MEVVFITKGYLRIEATNEHQQPVSNALIQIYHTDMSPENCIFTARTDESGRFGDVQLEAPDISYSQIQSTQRPYAQYHVAVTADGYDIEERRNVQVFPEVGSTLYVQMQTSVDGFQRRNVIIFEDHKLFKEEVSKDA